MPVRDARARCPCTSCPGRHAHGCCDAVAALGTAGDRSCWDLSQWWAPGTPGARVTTPAAPTPRRLVLSTGFTVINRQQRRLHDRAHPGFADLHSYLAARCQDNASLAQLADELASTVNVIRRLLDHAGLTHHPAGSAPRASAAAPPTNA
jgi:hypothetical protein